MKKTSVFLIGVCAFLMLMTSHPDCTAQELHLYGGAIRQSDAGSHSNTWVLEYKQELAKNWVASFSWLNEGHFEHHHRDGHSVQIWARTDPLWNDIVLAAGIGPYRYFDTQVAHEEHSYVDSHGWGAVLSFSATCPLYDRWLFSLRANFIKSDRSIDTASVLAGIGYRLEPSPPRAESAGISRSGLKRQNEITAYVGQVVVNSGESESDTAWSIEYRRNFGRYINWSIGWLDEGNPGPIHRRGLASELWLAESFFDNRLTLAVGAGPYVMIDKQKNSEFEDDEAYHIAGIVTMSGAYEFHPPWVVRVVWHRTVTSHNRDTDIILGGLGIRF